MEKYEKCEGCKLFDPFIDDYPTYLCKEMAERGEIVREPNNCGKWLCNNGACPHY